MSLLNSSLIMDMYSEYCRESRNMMREKQASPKEYGEYLQKKGRGRNPNRKKGKKR